MKATEILDNIKKIVFGDEQASVQLSEYSLADGTKIMVSDLAVGGTVTLEDGTPAPVGEHTLADGSIIVLSEGGVIAEVKMPEAPEEEMAQAPAAPNYETRFEEMNQSFTQQLQAVTNELSTLKQSMQKQDELNQKFIQMLETLIQEPATTPTEPVKSGFGSHKETRDEKLNRLLNANPFKK